MKNTLASSGLQAGMEKVFKVKELKVVLVPQWHDEIFRKSPFTPKYERFIQF